MPVTLHLFNAWGRRIGSPEPVRHAGEALSLWMLYRNAEYGILVASDGRPCEMLRR